MGLNRDFPPGHYYLGEAYLEHGQVNDAIRELEQAVSFKSTVPDFIAALGRAYVAAGRYSDASAQLERLKQLSRDQPVAAEMIESLTRQIRKS